MYKGRSSQPESRNIDCIGSDESAEDSESGNEDAYSDESTEDEQEDNQTAESSEEEEHVDEDSTDIFKGLDGTRWKEGPPSKGIDSWRTQARCFDDGPINGAENTNLTLRQQFELFFPPEIIGKICHWTNKYGSHLVTKWNSRNPTKPERKWDDTSETEIYAVMGLILLSGIEKAKKKPWKEMWSTTESVGCPPFVATMSRSRFSAIMSALRFDDAVERHRRKSKRKKQDPTPCSSSSSSKSTRIEPIQDVFDRVVANFQNYYNPAAKLCVDEQIIRFKGRCPFRVYAPQKPGKYGIKVWALVDNTSGYLLNLKIYEGKGPTPEVGLGHDVVLNLVDKYCNTERGVIADNFFSSYKLVTDLIDRKFTYCGTIRTNRREVPAALRNFRLLSRPDAFLFNEERQVTLLRHMHRPQKFVLLISSAHYNNEIVEIETTRGKKTIPAIIDYYNCNKAGVDVADFKISVYTGQFPSKRWPIKVFIHLLDCAAINAFVTWTHNHPTWKKGAGGSRRRLFLRDLAYDLIQPQILARAMTTPNLQGYISRAMAVMGIKYKTVTAPPVTPSSTSSKKTPTRCTFCTETRTRSRFNCHTCSKTICETHTTRLCPECFRAPSTVPQAVSVENADTESSDSNGNV